MTTDALDSGIAGQLAAIRQRIASAAIRSGRSPEAVRLVAVSKTFGPEAMRATYAAGGWISASRIQEALVAEQAATADLPLRWHLIGHLQSNKANRVAGVFDTVQSVDRLSLVERLSTGGAARRNRCRFSSRSTWRARPPSAGSTRRNCIRSIARAPMTSPGYAWRD